jgi:hypothetical protein
VIPDERDADRVVHLLPDILRARIFAIACGYEDADDLDRLRFDPALKLACGRLPDTGRDLCSQPTVSRWENAPNLRDLIRLMGVMVDLYCASYRKPPDAVTLDIDDTVDVVHGHQQLSLFNAHYDERCFLPIHVYDTATSRPVAVLLRPGKTPSGIEVRSHLRRLVRRIRRHWPQTRTTIRGDGHYSRPEVMEWCDENGVGFIFGLPGNPVLDRAVDGIADHFVAPDQQLGEVSPPHRHLFEANVFRPPKLQHTVERRDSNGHLGRLPPFGPRAQRVTSHSLVAADIGFYQGTPIVTRCPLPMRPRSAISCRCRSRLVGAVSAVALGTALERGGTMTAASG